MADVSIDADAANILAVNVIDGSTDPSAPGSGHAKLYIKDGTLYVRLPTGDPVAVGSAPTLAEGQLAIGDAGGALTALDLGTEGDVVTADASGFATWAAPAAGGAFLGARYHATSATTIANNSATVVNFDTADYDTNSAVTTGANWAFTVPSTGYYRIAANVASAPTNALDAGNKWSVELYVDNVLVAILGLKFQPTSTADSIRHSAGGSTTVHLTAAQVVDIRVVQAITGGGTLATFGSASYDWVAIEKVG